MTDLKVTHYKVGKGDSPCLNYLSLVLNAFQAIVISDMARRDVMGKMEFAGCELVLLKGRAMEEVINFFKDNELGVEPDVHELDAEQMLWYISTLESIRHIDGLSYLHHPKVVDGKQLTFQQLLSYRNLVRRNENDGNGWTTGWSQETFFMVIKYRGDGGITIGIEPDGYAHS